MRTLGVVLPFLCFLLTLLIGSGPSSTTELAPTWWHVFLIGLVVLYNTWAMTGSKKEGHSEAPATPWRMLLMVLAGVSLVTGTFYSLALLPAVPFGIVAILFFGLGLLILGPHFGLVATLIHLKSKQNRPRATAEICAVVIGAMLSGTLLLQHELSPYLSTRTVRTAIEGSLEERQQAVAKLRKEGPEEVKVQIAQALGHGRHQAIFPAMWRSGGGGPLPGILGSSYRRHSISWDDAPPLWYRIFGTTEITRDGVVQAFNAANKRTASRSPTLTSRSRNPFGAFDARSRTDTATQLAIKSSSIEASIQSLESTAYMEWTLVLENSSPWQQEGVLQLALPPDSVVSRATLWVKGEPIEAAFASVKKTTQAYESIVRRNRDPILLTSSGKNLIQLRAFPVPPSGEMKFRVGITAPLNRSATHLSVEWPWLASFNGDGDPEGGHAHVLLTADRPVAAQEGAAILGPRDGIYMTQWIGASGEVQPLKVSVPKDWEKGCVARTGIGGVNRILRQVPADDHQRVDNKRFIIVLDRSFGMRQYWAAVMGALRLAKQHADFEIIIPTDGGFEEVSFSSVEDLGEDQLVGGYNLMPAVHRAHQMAFGSDNSVILQVGFSQILTGVSPAAIHLIRKRQEIPWYHFMLDSHKRRPEINASNASSSATLIPAAHNIEQHLSDVLVTKLIRNSSTYKRDVITESEVGDLPWGSRHMGILWAASEVDRLLSDGSSEAREHAGSLAAQACIVSPVSGAVVLESKKKNDARPGPRARTLRWRERRIGSLHPRTTRMGADDRRPHARRRRRLQTPCGTPARQGLNNQRPARFCW